jgi:hypothetical protein
MAESFLIVVVLGLLVRKVMGEDENEHEDDNDNDNDNDNDSDNGHGGKLGVAGCEKAPGQRSGQND